MVTGGTDEVCRPVATGFKSSSLQCLNLTRERERERERGAPERLVVVFRQLQARVVETYYCIRFNVALRPQRLFGEGRGGEPRTSNLTFTQFLSSDISVSV